MCFAEISVKNCLSDNVSLYQPSIQTSPCFSHYTQPQFNSQSQGQILSGAFILFRLERRLSNVLTSLRRIPQKQNHISQLLIFLTVKMGAVELLRLGKTNVKLGMGLKFKRKSILTELLRIIYSARQQISNCISLNCFSK